MKQEYTDKMKYYQGKEYENFLREKCVLDARQFLYSSQLYLNYAIITAKLYEDIGKKNISEGEKNPFYNSVEVLGWNYNAHTILNKLTLEWVSHISNSLDCLLQYINASLNLGLKQKAVTEGSMHRKLEKMPQINSYVEKLWENEIVCYIRSVYKIMKQIGKSLFGCIFLQHFLLVYDTVAVTTLLIITDLCGIFVTVQR